MRGRYARALFACIGVLGVLGVVGALFACGTPGMAPNPTPPAIRTSGFHLLPDLPSVVMSPPFQQNGGGYQILTQQIVPDSHFEVSISWLDGTGRRDIALKYPCDSETAVSADGMWLACLANGATSAANNPTYYLETASLSASGLPHHAAIRLDAATDYRLPVWSPDGAYLALVRSPHKDGACSVQIFALSSDHSSATLRTTLTSGDPPACAVARLGWSSDGARLLILAYASAEPLVDIQVPVGALLQSGTSAATIPAADFTSVGRLQGSGNYQASIRSYVWNPVSGALAFITGDSFQSWSPPAQIAVYTPGQRETQTLFTLPYRGFTLLRLDWSSDGSNLLVGVGGPTCGECRFGVQNWYLYTPGD
jgi:Tol biopolymer transport system component